MKQHVDRYFYKTRWVLPAGSFLSWISGLKPYLQQRIFKEELLSVIEGLVASRKIRLKGKPLTDGQSRLIRHSLARKLGLAKHLLDPQKDEIRQLQRELGTFAGPRGSPLAPDDLILLARAYGHCLGARGCFSKLLADAVDEDAHACALTLLSTSSVLFLCSSWCSVRALQGADRGQACGGRGGGG